MLRGLSAVLANILGAWVLIGVKYCLYILNAWTHAYYHFFFFFFFFHCCRTSRISVGCAGFGSNRLKSTIKHSKKYLNEWSYLNGCHHLVSSLFESVWVVAVGQSITRCPYTSHKNSIFNCLIFDNRKEIVINMIEI